MSLEYANKMKRLYDSGYKYEALAVYMYVLDTFHESLKVYSIVSTIVLQSVSVSRLKCINTPSAWCIIAICSGYSDEAYAYACKAVDAGHIYALRVKANILFDDLHGDGEGVACLVEAAIKGCKVACADLVIFNYWVDIPLALRYGMLDVKYLHSIRAKADMKCSILGLWKPSLFMQPLVFPQVRKEQFTTMLVCKRLQVDRNIALIIVGYICTK